MMRRAMRLVAVLGMLMGIIGMAGHSAGAVLAQQGPTNLLVNGDFEAWDWNNPVWPFQDGIPEVQVCPGWRAFYLDSPPEGVTAPEYWKRPEFRDVKTAEFAYRVHSGFLAQKYFTFGGQHIAGLYQQVSGIAPGTPLRFAAYMETWGCMAGNGDWNVCPTGDKSNNPAPMHTRVGIDPYGGTSPFSPNVVWSPEINAYDVWTRFQVDAIAQAGTVTVFTYSYADWFDYVFRMANDVYVDDASLIALNEAPAPTEAAPTETPPPTPTLDPNQPTATPAPSATPAVTPTPRPDNAVVHVVTEGDTLGAIATQYEVAEEQITQLNELTDPNMLRIGQELVISLPKETPTAPPTEASLPTPTTTATAAPPAASVPTATLPYAPPTPTATLAPPTETGTSTVQLTPAVSSANDGSQTFTVVGLVAAIVVGVGAGFVLGRTRRV